MNDNAILNRILIILLIIIIFFIFVYESIRYDKLRKINESDPFDGKLDIKIK